MKLLVTRPVPDCERQAEALRLQGHEAIAEPLLTIEFLDAGRLPLKGVQALAATSRNGLRALARNEALARAKRRPVFAVGEATGEMARALGFAKVHTAAGTGESLVPLISGQCLASKGAILHLAGERLAFDLKGALEARGLDVVQPVLYRAVPAGALSGAAREAIAGGALGGVVLMSPATARCWAGLVAAAELKAQAAALRHYCLSEAVAAELGSLNARSIHVAETPREEALLALIAREAAH